jgi:hypothetical protein
MRVQYDEATDRARREQSPNVRIEITTIPPSEIGGPKTRATISGRVTGNVADDVGIAIYTRAYGAWYLQPMSGSVHPVKPDHTWSTWTHTGSRYAALLVRSGYEPLTKLDMLPAPSAAVLAQVIVDGTKGPATVEPAAVPSPH